MAKSVQVNSGHQCLLRCCVALVNSVQKSVEINRENKGKIKIRIYRHANGDKM